MEFSPFNNVVKLCLQGMQMEEKGHTGEALKLFLQGWEVATNDFEKFLAAYYVARNQKTARETLEWLMTALQFATKSDSHSANSALPSLYFSISKCYEELGDMHDSEKFHDLSIAHKNNPTDKGPFYHGTKADLNIGDLLTAGGNSNYQAGFKMNHIYFTAMVNGAGLAAALAKGDAAERVYIVEPTGSFENDPNLTDKKFPGNPTRSYRSQAPLKIVGEATQWQRPDLEELKKFREKVESNTGEIIN